MATWNRRTLLKAAAVAAAPRIRRQRPAAHATDVVRERLLLDRNWRFHFGHADDPARDFGYGRDGTFAKSGDLFAPSSPRFNADDWRALDLPHDWAVELPFVQSPDLNDYGYHPVGRDFPETSVGWYRRTFTLPADDASRRIALQFDGIFRDATIALNGHWVGRNASGYAPFYADVSDVITPGGVNTLVIRVDATEREGWFYEGAGIYRHTWLHRTAPVHLAHWGTAVRTDVGAQSAAVRVESVVANDADAAAAVALRCTVRDAGGRTVAHVTSRPTEIGGWQEGTITVALNVAKPELWSLETPTLYTLEAEVLVRNAAVDRETIPFGIRTFVFEPDNGLLVNGRRTEVQGTCNHQDHAGVGSALPDRLQYYRIERLKAMGCNAYRTSHNPPTPELLDACDRLGMLVLDENRMFSSETEGLSQVERMVRRDRNHPSIMAWSLANEEGADQGNERGARMIATIRRHVRSLDTTRPVTAAMNGGWGRGFTTVVDLQGFNYFLGDIDAIHRQFPAKPLIGTETASTLCTRGIYANDPDAGYMSAYDVNKPGWGATAEGWWPYFASRKFLAGGFVWTGFDYRGEPTPYRWPCINSHFGIMDTCGFPKDNFHYYRAWWTTQPVVHLFPHWNWHGKEGQPIDVWVHSNLERVELFLNGTSLGSKPVERWSHVAWQVPWTPGTIEARGYRGDAVVLTDRRETTGAAAAVVLVADRPSMLADAEDVVVIEARVVDDAGRTVPTANAPITFSVNGTAKIIGVGNGDPSSHEPDKATSRRAFNGLCCALVQSGSATGSVTVSASSPGLRDGSVAVALAEAPSRPAVA